MKELIKLGIHAEISNIEQKSEACTNEDMVLCYPIHGFNAPKDMIRFCKHMPRGTGNVWFLKTSGEPLKLNNNSSAQLIRIVRRKGYHVIGEFHYVMPYNMVFRHSDEMATLMWETARKRISVAAGQIASGTGSFPRRTLLSVLLSVLCRIEHPFFPLNGRLFRVDMDKCVKCMHCVNSCPDNNISFADGKFRFAGFCTECARCSFECPKDAIHIGLLDFMRVNGRYDFDRNTENVVIGSFCHDSYVEYFHLAGNKNK